MSRQPGWGTVAVPVLTKEDEYGESMNNELIACCGLDCGECDARRATLLNDDGLREETARRMERDERDSGA